MGLTVDEFAREKLLPNEFLADLGVTDADWFGKQAVGFEYRGQDGEVLAVRYRLAVGQPDPFRWPKGTRAKGLVYGLDGYKAAAGANSALIVEGESDQLTARLHGLPAFGIPGVSMFDDELTSPCLEGIGELLLVREPDGGGDLLVDAFRRSRLADRVRVVELGAHKDISDLHVAVNGDRERFLVEIERAIARARSLGGPLRTRPEPVDVRDRSEEELHYTDLGNARRMIARHGEDLRFVPGLGWHAWNERRWRSDSDGEVMRRMKETVGALYAEAPTLDDLNERQLLVEHALASEREPRLTAAVELAQTELEIVAHVEDLDADPYLLNCLNGTIDLRTSELREHRREDLITKLSPVNYAAGATHPAWSTFLDDTTGGDPELGTFLQRCAGYSLSADTGEEKLFFAHGPAATGKTTFLEALKAALGDYARTADFETFLKRRGDAGIRNDIARLAGSRLVVSVEVDQGRELAEGLVKLITGGDKVSARFLYREAFEFRPTFKIWLAANHRPTVDAADGAMWRRILVIPFTHVVPERERDPALKRLLRSDPDAQAAILAWAVEGFRAWQEGGLAIPEVVRDHTGSYREENDPLADWIADYCVLGENRCATARDLRRSYEDWAKQNGEVALANAAWGAGLRARGCSAEKRQGVRGWRGIAPKGVD